MRSLFIVVTLSVALSLAACGQKTEVKSGSSSVSVSSSGDHISVTGADGAKVEVSNGASAVAKLPDDLPLYPGAVVRSSLVGSRGDGTSGMVMFHAHATPAEIIGFYKQKAEASGMAQTMVAEEGATSIYVAANNTTKKGLQLSVTKASDGSDAQLVWSRPK